MLIKAPLRGTDTFGSGAYHAPRGSRLHRGLDYACSPWSVIYAPVTGTVHKIGYPYAQQTDRAMNAVDAAKFEAKKAYRYVDVLANGRHHRVFYISPLVAVGDEVFGGVTELGTAQPLSRTYGPRMTPHIHYEILTYEGGKKVDHDPADYMT